MAEYYLAKNSKNDFNQATLKKKDCLIMINEDK